ncbi:MAG: symmetrical bis(5'-nucleosyl)-tetraphosphatase [Burkholderiales bacterium]
MSTYVIGDVQGCFTELGRLFDRIRFDPANDEAWFVGDLVNRGPHSLEVLRYVRALGSRAIAVLGNHDLHLISIASGFGRKRADDTLDCVLKAADREALIAWLRGCPMLHATDRQVVVHAGLLPVWDVAIAGRLAREIEVALRGPDHLSYLENMYGSLPDRWHDTLAGFDRFRVVVNAMTRMRLCTADGRMELRYKGGLQDAPGGLRPWFAYRDQGAGAPTIISGHWSALGLYQSDRVICIDTGCVWGGALTALRLEDRRVFQEPAATRRSQALRK